MALTLFILFGCCLTIAFLPAILRLGMAQDRLHAVLISFTCGLTTFTTLTYFSTSFISLSPISVVLLSLAFLGSGIISGIVLETKTTWSTLKGTTLSYLVLAGCFLVFFPSSNKLLIERDGALWTGIINAYGDLGWHMANITTFVQGQSFLPENPIFAGERLIYPFLPNFFSAVLLNMGFTISQAFNVPAALLIPILLTLFYYFLYTLTKHRLAAIFGVLLLALGGSTFGFQRIFADFEASGKDLLDFLTMLPRDYSGVGNDKDGFVYINPVTSLLLPQRNFLFALPLAFVIATIAVHLLRNLEQHPDANPNATWLMERRSLLLGTLVGMMPLFHAHTMIGLLPIMAYTFFKLPRRAGGILACSTLVFALPEIAYYVSDRSLQSHLSWNLGWIAKDNIVPFWFKNTGFLLPITLVGLFISKNQLAKVFALSGLLLFLLANLVQFAVWEWDNYKVFLYWQLWTMPMVVLVLLKLWRLRFGHILVSSFILLHIASGTLDIFKTSLPTAEVWMEWDRESRKAAALLKQHTPAQSTILNAPIHNAPSALAGRMQYSGYIGHIWSHGRPYQTREKGIKDFLEGRIIHPPEQQVDFVLLGPVERSRYNIATPPSWVKVFDTGNYVLYDVKGTQP